MNREIVRYFEKTWKNKLCAIGLIAIGLFSACFLKDSTFLVFALFIGIPLFVSGKNHVL